MKTILDFIIDNKKRNPISFHSPGHKGRSAVFEKSGYGELYEKILSGDISCIAGADRLNSPHGLIQSSMEYYADLYGVKHTEFLLNGVGTGIAASILACVPAGGTLILGRNSSESAFDAMRLGGIQPAYITPEFYSNSGIQGEITVESVRAACEQYPEASAVLVTSPNGYGIISEIDRIADIAHNYGMVLIVDQSLGAHLRFFDAVNGTTTAAEQRGADIVIDDVGATLLSLEGTGILNICTDRVDEEGISAKIRMMRSDSSSYLLLGSLDVNEKIMRRWGGNMVNAWMGDLDYLYNRLDAISGVHVIMSEKLDPTKVSVSLASLGVTGTQLESELRLHNIVADKVNGDYVLFSTGAGNVRDDYVRLVGEIRNIANNYAVGISPKRREPDDPGFVLGCSEIPQNYESVPLYKAEGKVLAENITPYPPGSPVACPGEIVSMELIGYIAHALEKGDRVEGVDDEGYVKVGLY